MKNRLIPCVLVCLMIFLVGCTGNTAKEAAQEITKTETSFPASNTETQSQEETAEEPENPAMEETPTMDPFRSITESNASRVQYRVPKKFMPITFSITSTSRSLNNARMDIPALLMSISIPPNTRMVESMKFLQSL